MGFSSRKPRPSGPGPRDGVDVLFVVYCHFQIMPPFSLPEPHNFESHDITQFFSQRRSSTNILSYSLLLSRVGCSRSWLYSLATSILVLSNYTQKGHDPTNMLASQFLALFFSSDLVLYLTPPVQLQSFSNLNFMPPMF